MRCFVPFATCQRKYGARDGNKPKLFSLFQPSHFWLQVQIFCLLINCLTILVGVGQDLMASEEQENIVSAGTVSVPMIPPEGYLSPADILTNIRKLEQNSKARVLQIATTHEGREVLVMAFAEKETPGRPAILIVANPSGDRPVATQITMNLCEHFAAGGSPLIDVATVYIAPLVNHDAAEHAFAGGEPWRGRQIDEDRDGFMDEDPPEDVNGDGLVLQMRVADSTGEWRLDDSDARFMRKAKRDEGESGGWRLLREGFDNDYDRKINEDGKGGIEFEANWPHRWREHNPESGRFQLSEPETHGLADFMLAHPNIALVVVFSAEDNLSQPPEGIDNVDPQSTEPLKQDAALIKLLAERLLKDIKQKPRTAEHGFGNFADWAYYQFGTLVLESAVWSPPLDVKVADESDKEDEGEESKESENPQGEEDKKSSGVALSRQLSSDVQNSYKDETPDGVKLLRWNDQILGGAGFIQWTPFKHPELGDVEIGGWKPFVLHNPPAGEIEALSQRWIALLDSLAQDFASLSWEKAEANVLGNGTFDARITLVNKGLFPTITQMGERTRRYLPVRVTLELPETGQLLIGKRVQSVSRLQGLGGSREFRWVYQLPEGAEPARVRAVSQTAGEAIAVLEVKK